MSIKDMIDAELSKALDVLSDMSDEDLEAELHYSTELLRDALDKFMQGTMAKAAVLLEKQRRAKRRAEDAS